MNRQIDIDRIYQPHDAARLRPARKGKALPHWMDWWTWIVNKLGGGM